MNNITIKQFAKAAKARGAHYVLKQSVLTEERFFDAVQVGLHQTADISLVIVDATEVKKLITAIRNLNDRSAVSTFPTAMSVGTPADIALLASFKEKLDELAELNAYLVVVWQASFCNKELKLALQDLGA